MTAAQHAEALLYSLHATAAQARDLAPRLPAEWCAAFDNLAAQLAAAEHATAAVLVQQPALMETDA
jgi:hypothetical protein